MQRVSVAWPGTTFCLWQAACLRSICIRSELLVSPRTFKFDESASIFREVKPSKPAQSSSQLRSMITIPNDLILRSWTQTMGASRCKGEMKGWTLPSCCSSDCRDMNRHSWVMRLLRLPLRTRYWSRGARTLLVAASPRSRASCRR